VERLLNGRIDRLWRFLALVIVLFIAGLFYDDWRQFQVVSTELDRTGQIQRQTDILLSTITDAETGQRGYLLTGDPIYLDPYKSALRDLPGELNTLATLPACRR